MLMPQAGRCEPNEDETKERTKVHDAEGAPQTGTRYKVEIKERASQWSKSGDK